MEYSIDRVHLKLELIQLGMYVTKSEVFVRNMWYDNHIPYPQLLSWGPQAEFRKHEEEE